MSTKPTDSGRFAVDTGDSDALNISAPASGLRDTGFPNDYVPPASEFNYLENLAYRWRQWLFDGNCVFNNLAALGTLNVTGVTTLTGLLAANNVTVAGTIGVSGLVTLASLLVTGATTTNGLTATGLITADLGVTAAANQNLTVSGTGTLSHGTWTKVIAPHANGGSAVNPYVNLDAAGTIFNVSVRLDAHLTAGDTITAVRVWVVDSATCTVEFLFRTWTAPTGSPTSSVTSTVSAGSGALQSISATGLSSTVVTGGVSHEVEVIFATNGGSSVATIWSIEVDYTR